MELLPMPCLLLWLLLLAAAVWIPPPLPLVPVAVEVVGYPGAPAVVLEVARWDMRPIAADEG